MYAELHCHSCYSLREGASTPRELLMQARELGYEALALTDHDGLYGAMEFATTAKDYGIRPIVGAELTLTGGYNWQLAPQSSVDLMGGVRVWDIHAHVQVPGVAAAQSNTSFLDPVVAVRWRYDLGSQWSSLLYADAGGFGLGGFLTPTGVGTEVEKGKQVMEIKGKKYLLEMPIRADFALIFADRADENGNLVFRGALRNFNSVMAAAADVTIAEVREIVPIGALDPNDVVIPGALVNYIVEAKTNG